MGSSKMIQCTAIGMGLNSVTFNWMGPERNTLANDDRVIVTDSGLMSTVTFMYLMEGDEGTYTCNVMSSAGARRSESVTIETLTGKS